MAVLDHPVHVKTVGAETYGACQRKVRRPGYYAPQRRYFPGGTFELINVWIADDSSPDCRYDISNTDPKCAGCPRRGEGEAYNLMVRTKGKA